MTTILTMINKKNETTNEKIEYINKLQNKNTKSECINKSLKTL